ncbi:ubiquinone/menaquinone biosynthesis C-methylase UbiE [Aestuariispira insulae]|uniref:Ubiquinone/menaquinone biosynthesis C-methylase UbiE n=2 Tax=Aestuariispira insulae TaxID=1461337 RepID=A0A3D9HRF4_9PROT|nr:ubiquinone/menaquinone biosynthesis C-methylase UbiE [Aestuariispira insulae]
MTSKSLGTMEDAYDSPPWWYDIRGLFILTFAYNDTLWRQVRFFSGHIGDNHLDVACGTGSLLDLAYRYRQMSGRVNNRITGIDYAQAMLVGAVRRFRKRGNVAFHQADAAAMPFDDCAFDAATILNSLHALPDPAGALRDIHRVLKPQGTLAANILLQPEGTGLLARFANRINRWGQKKGILNRAYRIDEVERLLLDAGFAIRESFRKGNCFYVLSDKP